MSGIQPQLLNEFGIGWRKLIIAEVPGSYPSKVSNIEALRVALHDDAIEEMKADGFVWIVVIDSKELFVNADFHSEFFEDFSLQGGPQRFSVLNLSTWKLPEICQVDVVRSLGYEDEAVFSNDRGNNVNSH